MNKTTMTAKILNKKLISKGFLSVSLVEIQQNDPEGKALSPYFREVVERGDAAAVVIRDPITDELVFTRQFRVGSAIKDEDNMFTLDIVAGMIDLGSDAKETALRESCEEVGATDLKNVIQVAPTFFPSVGGCSETMTVFYAEADLSNLPKFKGEESENEYIEVVKMPTEKALSNLNMFPTSASIVGLMWLMMQRQLGNYC